MASVAWIGFGMYNAVEREKDGKWCLYNGERYVQPQGTEAQALALARCIGNCGHVAKMRYIGSKAVPVEIVEVSTHGKAL